MSRSSLAWRLAALVFAIALGAGALTVLSSAREAGGVGGARTQAGSSLTPVAQTAGAVPSPPRAGGAAAASKLAEPLTRPESAPKYVPRQALVRFKASTSAAQRAAARQAAGATSFEQLSVDRVQLLRLARGIAPAKAVARLQASGTVEYAQRNGLSYLDAVPNDAEFGEQWWLHTLGGGIIRAEADADIDAVEAWDAPAGTEPVTVAVIDSGVDYDHPDLKANLWTNPGETGNGREANGVDDDGNGHVDDWRGWNTAKDTNDPILIHEHGMHVAGTIAAVRNNGIGVAGVSANARVMPILAFKPRGDTATATDADLLEAVQYAVDQGARVVNGSYGGDGIPDPALLSLIASATDTLFVFASGNSGVDLDASPRYPCVTPSPNVICVGASDPQDRRASFSNYGAKNVDLLAPGVHIRSTFSDASYAYMSGTSMAAPVVSGVAAELRSLHGDWTPEQVKARLMESVDAVGTDGESVTGGRLNYARALTGALPEPGAEAAVQVADGRLTVSAPDNSARAVLTVKPSGSDLVVEHRNGRASAGSGCRAVDPQRVACALALIREVRISTGDRGDTISAKVDLPVVVDSRNGRDTVVTGAGADTIMTGKDRDTVTSGDGNDLIDTGADEDLILDGGGAGDDTIMLGDGYDVMATGGAGDDVIDGGPVEDELKGGPGRDLLRGGDGNDTLDAGGDPGDRAEGGAGDDLLLSSPGDEVLDGGADYDVASYRKFAQPLTLDMRESTHGAPGERDLFVGIEGVEGGKAGDTITGTDGPDDLRGGPGADRIFALGGDDIMRAGADLSANLELSGDAYHGGEGQDRVFYDDRRAPIVASLDGEANDGEVGEHDLIASDVEGIEGGMGNDQLTGSDGDDLLIGGRGNDWFSGGLGTDRYMGDTPEFEGGVGFQVDTVSYAYATTPVHAEWNNAPDDGPPGENENISDSITAVIGGRGDDRLGGGATYLNVDGGPGRDILIGGTFDAKMEAQDGEADRVICGEFNAVARVDAIDTVEGECASIDLTRAVEITGGPKEGELTSQARPTFTFKANDDQPHDFECRAQSQAFRAPVAEFTACGSPWTAPAVADGQVEVAIRVEGARTEAKRRYTIDTEAPETEVFTGPSDPSDSADAEFEFLYEYGTRLECELDGAPWETCQEFTTFRGLADGPHVLRVRSTDVAGNVDLTPAAWRWTIDTSGGQPDQELELGAFDRSPRDVSLTTGAEPVLDWIHWRGGEQLDRRVGTAPLTTWQPLLVDQPILRWTGTAAFGWTDATGSRPAGRSAAGSASGGAEGRGFRFTAPATDASTRKLRLWVGVRGGGAEGTLRVGFAGGASQTRALTSTSAHITTNRVISVEYRSTEPLTVEWAQTAGGATATVAIYAAVMA